MLMASPMAFSTMASLANSMVAEQPAPVVFLVYVIVFLKL